MRFRCCRRWPQSPQIPKDGRVEPDRGLVPQPVCIQGVGMSHFRAKQLQQFLYRRESGRATLNGRSSMPDERLFDHTNCAGHEDHGGAR